MAALRLSDINDVVTTTLDDYGPPTFLQCAQRLTRYEMFMRWWREEKVMIQSGIGITRRIMTDHDDDNLHVGPYSVDTVDFSDHLKSLRVEWVNIKKGWTFNYHELLANRGEALLTDLLLPKRSNAILNIASDVEKKGWSAPAGPDDNLVPYGVPFWVVKNAAAGFNGGNPSGFSTTAGINRSTVETSRNYTDDYDDVSEDDLLMKMHGARLETSFEAPDEVGGEGGVAAESFRIYVNKATHLRLNKLARAQNDSLGMDLAVGEGGKVTYAGSPMVYVPKLNEDTSDPVYMLYHDVFHPVVREDDFLRESEVLRYKDNHDTYVVWIDTSYNYICEDPRRQTVIAKM